MENKKIKVEITIPFMKIKILGEERPLALAKIFDLEHVTLDEALDIFKEDILRAYNYNLNKS